MFVISLTHYVKGSCHEQKFTDEREMIEMWKLSFNVHLNGAEQ